MNKAILVLGHSGSGKSTSLCKVPELGIKGLEPKETFLISVKDKPLPMKGFYRHYKKISRDGSGNYLATTDSDKIVRALKFISAKRKDIKNIVIDDFQYVMSDFYLKRAHEVGFAKFSQLGSAVYKILEELEHVGDKFVVLLSHIDYVDGEKKYKIKTIGKMMDNYITIEGLFTTVLYSVVGDFSKEEKDLSSDDSNDDIVSYRFATKVIYDENGNKIPAKTPIGMFDKKLIPNDMGLVKEYFNNFYYG